MSICINGCSAEFFPTLENSARSIFPRKNGCWMAKACCTLPVMCCLKHWILISRKNGIFPMPTYPLKMRCVMLQSLFPEYGKYIRLWRVTPEPRLFSPFYICVCLDSKPVMSLSGIIHGISATPSSGQVTATILKGFQQRPFIWDDFLKICSLQEKMN